MPCVVLDWVREMRYCPTEGQRDGKTARQRDRGTEIEIDREMRERERRESQFASGPPIGIKVIKSRTNSLVTLIQCNVAQ